MALNDIIKAMPDQRKAFVHAVRPVSVFNTAWR